MANSGGLVTTILARLEIAPGSLKESFMSELKSVNLKDAFTSMEFDDFSTQLKRKAYEDAIKGGKSEKEAADAAGAAGLSDTEKELLGGLKDLSSTFKDLGGSILGFVQAGFGFLEDIYKHMRRSSPLLETIENMFNLAMQLFFMPLGNKLGEIMIPAMINLLDTVMEIWEGFEGKTLGEMLSYAIKEGVKLVGAYFMDVGEILENEGGILGAIGSTLTTIGRFIDTYGSKIAAIIEGVLNFVTDNLGAFLLMASEFFIASLALLAGIYAYMFSKLDIKEALSKVAMKAATGAVFAAGNAAFIGSGGLEFVLGIDDYAEGGYIPSTPGGKIIRVAEGGEGEYIVPESRIGDFMVPAIAGSTQSYDLSSSTRIQAPITNNFYIEGLTNDELKEFIRDEVNEMVNQSRYRGGY